LLDDVVRFDPTLFVENGVAHQAAHHVAPLPCYPALYGNAETTLPACRHSLAQLPSREFTQNRLQLVLPQPQLKRQRRRKLPQVLIEKRRTCFERMKHRGAIDLGHVLSDKSRLAVVAQKVLQQIASRNARPFNASLIDSRISQPIAEKIVFFVDRQAIVRTRNCAESAG